MKTDELIRLLVASGAVKVTPGGRVTVEPSKMAGHWTNDGRHGWQRDGGGQDEQGQDSGAARDS